MPAATTVASTAQTPTHARQPRSNYNTSVGYLRAFITMLVLAHHAVLAYHPFAPAAPLSLVAEPRWWQAFPVVDTQRWSGFAVLVGFNDMFFMALMFFLSGLFVWQSLERKGGGSFLRDRMVRLGLPFLGAAALIAPLAYYPTYLQSRSAGGQGGFWHQWLSLGNWPSGPAWFVWVLLAFDGAAAALFLLWPNWATALTRFTSGADRRPAILFALLALISAAAYVPLAVVFNSMRWSAFGPFAFQTSRILHYFAYFLFGAGVGAYGLDRGLLAQEGKLARRWPLWSVAALIAFGVAGAIGIAALTAHLGSRSWEIAADVTWALSCAASSFAFLAIFVRFAGRSHRIFDSLNNNAYGMYLIHYAFVSWLQYAWLPASLPAIVKGSFVFVGTVLLSWGTTAVLRRLPAVARMI